MPEQPAQNQSSQPQQATGPNQGRRRPRGRGRKAGTTSTSAASTSSKPKVQTPTGNGENEPDSGSNDTENPTKTDVQADAIQEQDLCWICAEPVKYYAVSECNHRTCHVCALRLRALYKKPDCTFCKVRAQRLSYLA